MKNKKRLGIFIFYDRQEIVDDYVLYLLSEMSHCTDDIITVSNSKLSDEQFSKLNQYSSEIHVRPNHGMDAGALKDFFTQFITPERLDQYEELVWFNDTCYGPIYSMKDIFQEMDERGQYDFWGITAHAETNVRWYLHKDLGVPAHIQSYFVVIKHNMFMDERFLNFWNDLEISDDFNITVYNYEISFTKRFQKYGYQPGVYCNTLPLDNYKEYAVNLTAYYMYGLVTEFHCPFMKRKNFIRSRFEVTYQDHGEDVRRTMEYVEKNTAYPKELIYQNLLRLYDSRDLKQRLGLVYHFSKKVYEWKINEKVIPEDVVIILEVNHMSVLHELRTYIMELSQDYKCIIVTNSEDVKKEGDQFFIGQLNIEWYVGAKDNAFVETCSKLSEYEEYGILKSGFVCLIPEHYGTPLNGLEIVQKSDRYMYYENLIATKEYIQNVLGLMKQNPYIGICQPGIAAVKQNESDEQYLESDAYWIRTTLLEKFLQSKSDMERFLEVESVCIADVLESRCAATIHEIYQNQIREENWRPYQQAFRKFRGIEYSGIGELIKIDARRILKDTLKFFLKKKLHQPISEHEKIIHNLGVKEIYQIYQDLKKSGEKK